MKYLLVLDVQRRENAYMQTIIKLDRWSFIDYNNCKECKSRVIFVSIFSSCTVVRIALGGWCN